MHYFSIRSLILALFSVLIFSSAQAAVEFCYEGECGPEHWADLSPYYHQCRDGLKQSPINVYRSKTSSSPILKTNYKATPLTIVNNGHTVQVNYATGSTLTVGTKKYRLLQFHFHTPSEHLKDGRSYPLEGHLVHIDDFGGLAVLGVFLKEGDTTNAFLKPIFDNLPKTEGEVKTVSGVNVNVTGLLPRDREYYGYSGSLTTPPCSEGVSWMVLENTVTVSKAQLEQFRAIFHGNARPEQPLNGRTIRFVDD